MSLYVDTAGELREIGDSLMAAWREAGNPKAIGWMPAPPKPSEDSVWRGGEWVLPDPPGVPPSVSPYQFRLCLLRRGVSMAAVDAMIDALPQPAQDEARVAWEYGLEVRRDHPLVSQFAAALGMTEAQVDAAFVEAATL